MKFLEKVSNNMAKFKFEIKKHSPEILRVVLPQDILHSFYQFRTKSVPHKP